MEWISHQDRTLKEHLAGLKKVVDNFLPEKEQHFFSPEELRKEVYASIAYHDLAKASIYFQLYLAQSLLDKNEEHRDYSTTELENFIKENKSHFEEWQREPELKNHSLFGAWMSLYFWDDEIEYTFLPFLFLTLLKGHHGHLRNFNLGIMNPKNDSGNLIEISKVIDLERYSKMMQGLGLPFRYGSMEELLSSFSGRKFGQLVDKLPAIKDDSLYFKTLFLYSFLLSADKGDMMLQDKRLKRTLIKSDVIDVFKKETIKSGYPINALREEAYQTAVKRIGEFGEQNFYSITLPTGLGKTFIAYKAALYIKEKYALLFKIVYCLPFTSIIDQNAGVFKEILKNNGIVPELMSVHHHLSVPGLKEKDDDADERFPNWEYMTEGWQKEITITTFVQLWESIFACHSKPLRKFHNLVNSVIILDEVQSINPQLYPAFEFVLEAMAKYFNTKFIFVTATQPIILKGKVYELCLRDSPDFFFKKMNRTTIDRSLLTREKSMSEEDLTENIIENFAEGGKSILVICNTIRYSQTVFKLLQKQLDKHDLCYLSASLIPRSRELRLAKIRARLDRKDPIILVSTQVVEAGVDIDFDTVYRDFAPLSSINQAAGRCNRNAESSASTVHLFRSGKEKIYDPTQLDITKRVLDSFTDKIQEAQFYELNERYFQAVKDTIQDGSGLSEALIKDILKLNFQNVGTDKKYRLFTEKYKTYDFFIPLGKNAKKLWAMYLEKLEIEDNFKRKQAIKMIMPHLTKFVVNIPDYVYTPNQEEKERMIINSMDWREFYDETLGYKPPVKENPVEIF